MRHAAALAVLGLALLAPLPSMAQTMAPAQAATPAAPIAVTRAWARATAADAQTGAAYFTLVNNGPTDALTGASTPVAKSAELHRTINANGVMQMRPVKSVTVGHGKIVTFAPGGYHVMLVGLTQPLTVGETFPLTLTFKKAGDVTVTATVQNPGAMAPTMGKMPGM